MTILSSMPVEASAGDKCVSSKAGCVSAVPMPTGAMIPSASPRVSRLRNEVGRCRDEVKRPWAMKPSVGTWLGKAPTKVCVEPKPCRPESRESLLRIRAQLDEVLESLPARSIAPPAGAQSRAVVAEMNSALISMSLPVCPMKANIRDDAINSTPVLPPNEIAPSPVCSKSDETYSDDAMLPPNELIPSPYLPTSDVISSDDAMFRTTPLPVNGTAPCALAATTGGIAPCCGIAPPPGAFSGIAPPAAHGIAPPAGQVA